MNLNQVICAIYTQLHPIIPCSIEKENKLVPDFSDGNQMQVAPECRDTARLASFHRGTFGQHAYSQQ
jgi:hypothetical protein